MNPEEKIKELEQRIVDIERVACRTAVVLKKMSTSLEPMFLEWRDEKENNIKEATEVLYGNIRHDMITYVNKFDDPKERKCACKRLLIYATVLHRNITDNSEKVEPPHNVYPLSPGLSKMLFNKNDPLDKQILELHKKKVLNVKVVEVD